MALGDLVPWLAPWGRKGRDLAPRPAAPALAEGAPRRFLRLHEEMNRLFDEVFRDLGRDLPLAWPRIEVARTGDGYRLTAELPGMDARDIDLSIRDGVLILRGEIRSAGGDPAERFHGAFERRVPVGDVDEGRASARLEGGVLTVILPRSAAGQERVRRIPIDAEPRP